MGEFKGFKSVQDLKLGAYGSAGWTQEGDVDAEAFLDELAVAGREFFARMAELQPTGRPASTQRFRVPVPAFIVERGLPVGGVPVEKMFPLDFVVDSQGRILSGAQSDARPLPGVEFVLGRGGLRMPEWSLFEEHRSEILDAMVEGMAAELERESERVFLGR